MQALNLTNEVTKTLQQFTVDGAAGTAVLLHERPPLRVHHPRFARRRLGSAATAAAAAAASATGDADVPGWIGDRSGCDLPGPRPPPPPPPPLRLAGARLSHQM